jgi:mono/diheme cytochrome c family protein
MSAENKPAPSPAGNQTYGVLAEYVDQDQLIKASKVVRDKGFSRWDTYSPYPVHGIDPAMGIKRTRLPWATLCAALTGLATAITMQWWMNVIDYRWLVSGKPFWSVAANVPIMFELTVLFSALTTFFTMLIANKLLQFSSPLDRVRRFARSTDDRFFLVIETADPKFDEADVKRLLEGTAPAAVEVVPADTSSDKLPLGLVYGVLILGAFAMVPFGIFASSRESKTTAPPYNLISNMDYQQKYKAQADNDFFEDGRAMRQPIEGTVAVGKLREDSHFFEGKTQDGSWVRTLPEQIEANEATMARGEERFGIYCAPCHGLAGDGDGMVHRHAFALGEGTWVKPTNVANADIMAKPAGELFNTISKGIRNMPGYERQIETADRWAIVLYLRALQKSQAEFAAAAQGGK